MRIYNNIVLSLNKDLGVPFYEILYCIPFNDVISTRASRSYLFFEGCV